MSLDDVDAQVAGALTLLLDGQLEFSTDERFTMIKLLNEDLYSGGLTGEGFEAQRKGRLQA